MTIAAERAKEVIGDYIHEVVDNPEFDLERCEAAATRIIEILGKNGLVIVSIVR